MIIKMTNFSLLALCGFLLCLPNIVSSECIIDPAEKTVSSEIETYFINVNAEGDCVWGAESIVAWITIEDGSVGWETETVSGNGFIKILVEENTEDTSRKGTIEIAGIEFIITQLPEGASVCSQEFYIIEPENISANWEGSSGTVLISTTNNCTWKATSRDSWISITDGTPGWEDGTASEDGSITYSVEENLDDEPRTGKIRIANHDFTVNQEGEDRPPWPCIIKTISP